MPREVRRRESPPMLLPLAGGSGTVVTLGELMMILELHRQGLKVSAIARQLVAECQLAAFNYANALYALKAEYRK